MINYDEIIENLSTDKIITLMENLGVSEYKIKEGYIIFPTICHNSDASDASMKLYYYTNTHLFMCYTECGGMNIFKFLQHYYESRNIVYDWYNDILRVILDCSSVNLNTDTNNNISYKPIRDKYKFNTKEIKLESKPKGIIEVFDHSYPIEWLNDGITKEAMDKYNIRYSILNNKIIIPHYDICDELIGIRGRALNPEDINQFGKYMPVMIEGIWYSHPLSLNLYGLNKNKENIKHIRKCFICESEKSVLQAESFNMPNCVVSVCGSNLNKFQIELLMKYCPPEEIIICFDNEEKNMEDKYFNKLYSICKKYNKYANFSFVYDRFGLTKLKDSPTDHGEEIFRKLIESRVKVK